MTEIKEAPHPGIILRNFLEKKGLSQLEFAEKIGTTVQNLNIIINQKRSISPIFSIQLGEATGHSPYYWIELQMKYDVWMAWKKISSKK